MVAPERETPGIIASPCAAPVAIAFQADIFPFGFGRILVRSNRQPVKSSMPAAICGAAKTASSGSRNTTYSAPVGIMDRRINAASRKCLSSRYCAPTAPGRRTPFHTLRATSRMRDRYTVAMLSTVPKCTKTSKVMWSVSRPSPCRRRTRCPEEDTGRNSVIP